MGHPNMAAEEVVARYVEEAWNRGNIQIVDELLTPGHVRRDSLLNEPVVGIESVKAQIVSLQTGFPDFHFDVWIIPSANGEFVTRRWIMIGTHLVTWRNITPTGVSISSTGMAISRMEDGLIAEEWVQRDDLDLLRQIGAWE